MTDRPILFSAPMVQALLAGRKTQTRRMLNPQPYSDVGGFEKVFTQPPYFEARDLVGNPHPSAFPQGKHLVTPFPNVRFAIGDRLWVKETWRTHKRWDGFKPSDITPAARIWHEADGRDNCDQHGKTRVSIFMPRWASRLTLLVTDVRVERLQDCSQDDAIAEGIEADTDGWRDYLMPSTQCCMVAQDSYATLWNSINGPGAWEANPWVVAVSFDVQRGNTDTPASKTQAAEVGRG